MVADNILSKVLDKSTAPKDYGNFLKWLWRIDEARPCYLKRSMT